jgi:hypothetical protein
MGDFAMGFGLHEAAEELLDELVGGYVVERREGKEPYGLETARAVWLVPRSPAAGPLAIVFAEPAAIVLRLGRWFSEQPSELEDLRRLVAAHIEGGLWEQVRRGLSGSWRETRLIGAGIEIQRQAPLDASEARSARREGFAAPVSWAPWPRRAPNADG